MKTTENVVNVLYTRLNVTEVTTVISGSIYLWDRPEQSEVEDIVINCLPISNTQPQRTTANINIYVKDLQVEVGGKPQYMPDTARIKEIAAAVIPLIEQGATGDYMYSLANQTTLRERDLHTGVLNLRVDFLIIKN